MKFLQLNLGGGKGAQELLMQTAGERRANVLLISEQHKWSGFLRSDEERRGQLSIS